MYDVNWSKLTQKQKRNYIIDYWSGYIFAGLLIISVVVGILITRANRKEPILQTIMVNASYEAPSQTNAFDGFLTELGYNANQVYVESQTGFYLSSDKYGQPLGSVESIQRLGVSLMAGGSDLIFCTQGDFDLISRKGGTEDLSQYLPASFLAEHKDALIFTDEEGSVPPYPCGISVTNGSWLENCGYYTESCIVGLLHNGSHKETAIQFFYYLLENM